ncbi:hypothetical protein BRADI_4g02324v3 [Brachypodium distachyon]|uniref:Uncharacterized protein n=1 Tax=Brachypodium distachyon TaxID=15368 RepID=A0A2K2CK08_BRADI|nr:hypothetical protein BRADI_4g02324v3 [Brachypodium distachyon]
MEEDMSYFVVYAWMENPDEIPKEVTLDIPEPPALGLPGQLADGLIDVFDDYLDSDNPNPPELLSHTVLIHLDSLLILPPHQGNSSRRGRRSDRVQAYRFCWARRRLDGTADIVEEMQPSVFMRLGCSGDLGCHREVSAQLASTRAPSPSVGESFRSSDAALLPPPYVPVMLPLPEASAQADLPPVVPAPSPAPAPPLAPAAPAPSPILVPVVLLPEPTALVDPPAPVVRAAAPPPTPVVVPHMVPHESAAPPLAPAVVADVAATAATLAGSPSLADFLHRVAEAVTPGLLQLARPAAGPVPPRKSKKPSPKPVRRSCRLASKKLPAFDDVLSRVKRLICKKLGVIFDEAASDDAAMLSRYAASFEKPLSEVQIAALTALAQRGAEKTKKAWVPAVV